MLLANGFCKREYEKRLILQGYRIIQNASFVLEHWNKQHFVLFQPLFRWNNGTRIAYRSMQCVKVNR